MRIYEELFIVKPDAPEEKVDAYIATIRDLIRGNGGTVAKEEKWGKRKLAYRVAKFNEVAYVLLEFTSAPETIPEIERRMRVTDMVIKFLTVRRDERLKKVAKRQKRREERAARRPAPPAAPPAMPSESAHAAPGAPAAPGTPAAPVAVESMQGTGEGTGE